MSYFILVLPILLPVFFWAGYHYYKDRHAPEPLPNLLICFLLGVAGAYLGQAMYVALGTIGLRYDAYELAANNLWALAAYSVLVIGGIEETAKCLPFLLVAFPPSALPLAALLILAVWVWRLVLIHRLHQFAGHHD